jgi:hypothetical protein
MEKRKGCLQTELLLLIASHLMDESTQMQHGGSIAGMVR